MSSKNKNIEKKLIAKRDTNICKKKMGNLSMFFR